MFNAATLSRKSEDDEDAIYPPSDLPYYKGWTFTQVQEFKFDIQGNMQGIVTPSRMFYSCLAYTVKYQTRTNH